MNNFKKLLSALLLSTCFSNFSFSQTTGSFNKEITVDSGTRLIEYAVPSTYNANEKYALLVALQGCGSNTGAAFFRDQLEFVNNDFKTIVVAPKGLSSLYHKMDDVDSTIISKSIQDALGTYNIDENHVFLTGFSCNGYVTAKYGTYSTIFPFAGIIPFNAGINMDQINAGDFNLETEIPTCICIGELDPNLETNKALADSITNNGGDVIINEMAGVGHTITDPSFKTEVSECMTWLNNQLPELSTAELENQKEIIVWNNSTGQILSFELKQNIENGVFYVYDSTGKVLQVERLNEHQNSLDFSGMSIGTVLISFKSKSLKEPISHVFIVN